jgi:predicted glycosyltransferase
MTRRILFYVQHLVGIGHLRRAEILARTLAAEGLEVVVAYGGAPMPEVAFAEARVAFLPAATVANEDFSTLLDSEGRAVDDQWRARRRDALLALCRKVAPDVLLFELFPFGRRQFRFELVPLLETAANTSRPPRVLCSVRDILVESKNPERVAETVETIRRYFDAVLVHGDPALVPFENTFPAAAQISDKIHYTGYIAPAIEHARSPSPSGEVLVSAGGGAVGMPLLQAALAARPLSLLATAPWRILTGPNLPDEAFAALRGAASGNTIVERFRPEFPALLAGALLSISQGGYNTTMDILRSGARAVVVPFEQPGETEQRLRAEILAERGLLTLLPSSELSPEFLAQAMSVAMAKPRLTAAFDFEGAGKTARLVHDFAAPRQSR